MGKNVNGIHRNDTFACFENIGCLQAHRIRKDFINTFKKEFQPRIVCEINLKIVNFLDATGRYKPYNRPGNIPLYINIKSKHPPNFIKILPGSISRHFSKLSSDKSELDNSKDLHNNAVSSSGFKDKIKFGPYFNKNISSTKNKIRKIVCFNSPDSSNVSTNIGKMLLTILDRHFPKSHKLYKILNRNKVKISYSPTPNFASIINSHNKKIINNNIPKSFAPTQLVIVVQKYIL